MATYKVVTSDQRVVFSDCTFDEAKHFAASLPEHTQPQVLLQGVPECSRCLGVGYVRSRQPGNAAFGVYQCPKCSDD